MQLIDSAVYIQKCNQLFTAIVTQDHKPTNMAAGVYVMSPKSPVHLSVDLPELSLVFQQPRCFLVTPSSPGGNLVILSDSPRLLLCHDNCTRAGDKRARNNMPQLYHIHAFVRVWRRVRRQRAEQCQGLCFLWLPISCPLFSTAPWLVQDVCMYIHTCTHLTHTKTLKDKERHAGGDARKKEPLTRRWKFRGRIVIILPKPEHFVITNSELSAMLVSTLRLLCCRIFCFLLTVANGIQSWTHCSLLKVKCLKSKHSTLSRF